MTITLYHAVGSCAFAPLVALEEAGVEYDLRLVALAQGEQRSEAYLGINPHGRVPAMTVEGQSLSEAVAILHYIATRYPEAGLLPEDAFEAAKAYEIAVWIASSVHVALAQIRRPARFLDDADSQTLLAEPGRQRFRAALAELDGLLANGAGEWITGSRFTLADPYVLVVVRWAEGLEIDLSAYPALAAHAARMRARPSVQRAMEREQSAPRFLPN